MAGKLPWFRMYNETLHDTKLKRCARVTVTLHVTLLGTWTALLCLANDSAPSGKLAYSADVPMTDEDIADEIGLDVDTWTRIRDAFLEVGLIEKHGDFYIITAWDKRQYKSDSSAARVAKHRAKQKRRQDVTLRKRYGNAPDTDTDTDTDLKTEKPPTRKKPESVEFPPSLDNPDFRKKWDEWIQYRRKTNRTINPITLNRQLAQLADHVNPAAVLELSITNGWAGIFPKKITATDQFPGATDRQAENLAALARVMAEDQS